MADVMYSKIHSWAKKEDDLVLVGITNYAQEQLKDIVYVDFPELGEDIVKGERFASVESVKTLTEPRSPVSGKVVEVNDAVDSDPSLLNKDAMANWIVKLKFVDDADFEDLITEKEYLKMVK